MGIKEDKIIFEAFAKKKKRQSLLMGILLVLMWILTANPFRFDGLYFIGDNIPQFYMVVFHTLTRVFLILWLYRYNQYFHLDLVYAVLFTLFSPALALVVVGLLKSKKDENNFYAKNKFD
ncbi:MAG: hypothetical protein WC044_04120 [Crocinitomicaceae bacterium]